MNGNTSLFAATSKSVRRQLRRWNDGTLKDRVCFLHIPKTAGSSIIRAIEKTCSSPLEIAHLDPATSRRCAQALGMGMMEYRDHLLTYFLSLQNLRFVSGHFAWSEAAYELFGVDWNFVTVLRNPVDRWLSNYFYDRHKSVDHFRIEEDIEAYLETQGAKRLGRILVTHLSGASENDGAVDRAVGNLTRFRVVGFVEQMDLFTERFAEAFDVTLRIPHANKNPAPERRAATERRHDLIQRITEICGPDISVYEAARSRFT